MSPVSSILPMAPKSNRRSMLACAGAHNTLTGTTSSSALKIHRVDEWTTAGRPAKESPMPTATTVREATRR